MSCIGILFIVLGGALAPSLMIAFLRLFASQCSFICCLPSGCTGAAKQQLPAVYVIRSRMQSFCEAFRFSCIFSECIRSISSFSSFESMHVLKLHPHRGPWEVSLPSALVCTWHFCFVDIDTFECPHSNVCQVHLVEVLRR